MSDLNPYGDTSITGAMVSQAFMDSWRSRKYVGNDKPFAQVSIRRGHFVRTFHTSWPGPNAPATVLGADAKQFGPIVGRGLGDTIWYPDWTPTTDWIPIGNVYQIDLDQQMNFADSGGNGICTATVTVDNVSWQEQAGEAGMIYHKKERGWFWPWRGYQPTNRPGGSVEDQNLWYKRLPNSQILIEQGYGADSVVKTFTGLVDNIGPGSIRPDRITISGRDFGGMLVDTFPFMWNMDKRLREPVNFVPPDYPRIAQLEQGQQHNWIIVEDVTDMVRCALRWSGFKEWEIEDAGVGLKTMYTLDRSRSWMDMINDVASQLGYVFFIAEPSGDDLSIGVPVFRKQAVLKDNLPDPILLNSQMLTDIEPTHNNTDERHIIRVRGRPALRQDGGRPILGGDMNVDGQVLYTFTYWPPWALRMAGVIKQLTEYNIGQNGVLGFGSNLECAVACVLIAVQIALALDTATVQCPGQPAFGLDSMAMVDDDASEIKSRLYITSRKSTWTKGGDGSSNSTPSTGPGQTNDTMAWWTELSGSLVDNEDWAALYKDYQLVISGHAPVLHNPTGVDPVIG